MTIINAWYIYQMIMSSHVWRNLSGAIIQGKNITIYLLCSQSTLA